MDAKQLTALLVSLVIPIALRVLDKYLGTHMAQDKELQTQLTEDATKAVT